jgi:hypothetical protein
VRGILRETATYPDHVLYDSAGGHCVFFYQFCQVVESSRWGWGEGQAGKTSARVIRTILILPLWTAKSPATLRRFQKVRNKSNNPCAALPSLEKQNFVRAPKERLHENE